MKGTVNEKNLEISKMLTISTAHISKETADFLKWHSEGFCQTVTPGPVVYDKDGYGFFIPITNIREDTDAYEKWPEDFKRVTALGEEAGCDWLCLDCDGPVLKDLAVYR